MQKKSNMNNLNNLEEIWRDIDEYEGYYQISNLGNVKSLPRVIVRDNGRIHTVREKILKPGKDRGGYQFVILSKDGKTKTYTIHRLVASAFLENPNNYEQVNHIDEDKTNNVVSNLEWCDAKYNMNYGTRTERQVKSQSKQVAQIDKNTGEIIKIWESTMECERNGFNSGNISKCCNGKRNSHKGYIWKYIDNVA